MRLSRADAWPAAALTAAGIALFIYEWRNPTGTPLFGVSPGTVPMATTAVIAALALALLVQTLFASDDAVTMNEIESDDRRAPTWRAYAFGAFCVVYVFIMPWLGYLVASALFVAALAWLFGNRWPIPILIMTVVTPFALSFFFEKAMVVYLPASRLFE